MSWSRASSVCTTASSEIFVKGKQVEVHSRRTSSRRSALITEDRKSLV
ncbi:MAG: hypothetical protein ACLSGI_07220 [Butyricicoccaceae bacterium]